MVCRDPVTLPPKGSGFHAPACFPSLRSGLVAGKWNPLTCWESSGRLLWASSLHHGAILSVWQRTICKQSAEITRFVAFGGGDCGTVSRPVLSTFSPFHATIHLPCLLRSAGGSLTLLENLSLDREGEPQRGRRPRHRG